MSKALSLLIVAAAGLAGCAGATPSPTDTRPATDRTLPPGQGAFGSALTWEMGKKEEPGKPAAAAPAAAATAAEQEEFKKWRESVNSPERQEFEEWRAWQEWKRKNPR